MPRAIDHHMNEYCGELLTFADHLGEFRAKYGDQLRRLLGDHGAWRRNQARIRHEAGDISSSPFHNLAPAAALFDVNGKMTTQDDMKSCDRSLLRSENASRIQRMQSAVIGDPCNFVSRQRRQSSMCCQTIYQRWSTQIQRSFSGRYNTTRGEVF